MLALLLPDATQLCLQSLVASDTQITLSVATTASSVPCPRCKQATTRRHSRYERTLADLPWGGIPVRLRVQTRRFFCDNTACAQRIFTERMPTVATPSARRTCRLNTWFTRVAFAVGGAPGARLLQHSGWVRSRETLLRCIRTATLVPPTTPTILSVDDFAFRRGRHYGTILVDLERRQVVDLLPDRSAATFAAWLHAHPGVQVISRDRGGDYAEGAKRGAPTALQVADRFHLVQNLGDVARRVLQRHAALVQQVPAPGPTAPRLTRLRLDRIASHAQAQMAIEERYAQIQTLAAEGLSTGAIARRLQLNWKTVQKYRRLPAPPERRHQWHQGTDLAPYEGYLLRRWAQGARNARALWREIQAQGFPGAYNSVVRLTAYLQHQERAGKEPVRPPAGLTPRQVVVLVLRRPAEQTEDELQAIAQVKALDPALHQALTLLEEFAALIRARPLAEPAEQLARWLTAAEHTGLPEFISCARKLRQDWAAVVAGLHLPWSQGQTEGRINTLKLLKRAMYGRSGFPLLRQRVLAAPAA